MSNGAGRRPDYTIVAYEKDTEVRGEIGVAWDRDDGNGIYLKFNPYVVVPVGPAFSINVFPVKGETDSRRKTRDVEEETEFSPRGRRGRVAERSRRRR